MLSHEKLSPDKNISSMLKERMESPPSRLHGIQLRSMTKESLGVKPGDHFSPGDSLEILRQNINTCLAIDIGGTKMSVARVTFVEGLPVFSEVATHLTTNGGADFYPVLQQYAKDFSGRVAISIAGEVEDKKTFGALPNLPGLIGAMGNKNNFEDIFVNGYTLANDAKCGLVAVATANYAKYEGKQNVVFVIDGTGIGGATLDVSGKSSNLEPGHVKLNTPALNPFDYSQACDPNTGRLDTCLERIGALGAGAVAQWNKMHPTDDPNKIITSGIQLLELARAGDRDAIDLIMLSTQIVATISAGIVTAQGFNPSETVIVYGGGASHIAERVARLSETLQAHFQEPELKVISAYDEFGIDNPSLYGAAILAGIM